MYNFYSKGSVRSLKLLEVIIMVWVGFREWESNDNLWKCPENAFLESCIKMFNTSNLGQIKIYFKTFKEYFIHQLHSNLGRIEIKILLKRQLNSRILDTTSTQKRDSIDYGNFHTSLPFYKTMNLENLAEISCFDSLHVLRLTGHAEVFKHVSQELKRWPFKRVLFPALQHYLKTDGEWGLATACYVEYDIFLYLVHIWLGLSQLFRTSFRLWIHDMYGVGHPVAPLHLLYGLLVVHACTL